MKKTILNLKKVYEYGKKYRKYFIIFTIISIINIGINIAYPIFSSQLLVALTGTLFKQVMVAAIICAGMSIFCDFTTVLLRRSTQRFFRGTTKDLQLDIASTILDLEVTTFDKHGTGTFTQRIGHDADELSHVFTRGMGYLTGIFTDIGIFIALFIINKPIFFFYVICSLILTLLQLSKAKAINTQDKIHRRQNERTYGLLNELVRGIRDIKMLYAKSSFTDALEENIDLLTETTYSMRNTEIDYNCLIDVSYDTCEFGLIIMLIYLLTTGGINVSSAIVVFTYRTRVFNDLMHKVDSLLEEIRTFNLSSDRVFSLINNKEFKKEKFGRTHLDKIDGNFEFKNVYFSYGDNQVLKNMSFKIETNKTIAFVGRSGVGKTTIFSLLCKLYDANAGNIYIDGHDINDLDEESIRNNITIISQNPYIFNMSIRDNFRLIKKDVTDPEIKEACKLACLDEYIESLPDKYDTLIGEGGINLSGGQRQRLAIARAFVQNTKIILFDEATSALDNETQGLIQKAIDNMKDKYTILIIAHRLSTVINSDKIMVISDGHVVAKGTHKYLLSHNSEYKKLYEIESIAE